MASLEVSASSTAEIVAEPSMDPTVQMIRSQVFAELQLFLPPVRMPSSEPYRIDPADGDAYTRREFQNRYGTELGGIRWEQAGVDPNHPACAVGGEGVVDELRPEDGDIIRFRTKGALASEAIVLRRQGRRLRVGLLTEKTTWIENSAVLAIIAARSASDRCLDYRVDVKAVEFGRCVCGLLKAQHDAAAILPDRPTVPGGETGGASGGGAGGGVAALVVLKDHRLPRGEEASDALRGDAGGEVRRSDGAPSEQNDGGGEGEGENEGGNEGGRDTGSPILDEEYRLDPADGFAYTQTDFLEKYGGTAEWNAAEPVRESVILLDD